MCITIEQPVSNFNITNQIKRLEWFRWFHYGSTSGSVFYSMKSTWFRWFRIYAKLSHVCVRLRVREIIKNSGTSGTSGTTIKKLNEINGVYGSVSGSAFSVGGTTLKG